MNTTILLFIKVSKHWINADKTSESNTTNKVIQIADFPVHCYDAEKKCKLKKKCNLQMPSYL